MKKNKLGAFTLLELLVVIAIMAILISLGVASFSNAQRKSRDSRRREDIKAVQNGLEQYYADHDGSYPKGAGTITLPTMITTAGSDYFPAGEPVDPKNADTYVYSGRSDGNKYCVCAKLETTGVGNSIRSATSVNCGYTGAGSKDWFCVSNLQ